MISDAPQNLSLRLQRAHYARNRKLHNMFFNKAPHQHGVSATQFR
jgi:hypothetical protein